MSTWQDSISYARATDKQRAMYDAYRADCLAEMKLCIERIKEFTLEDVWIDLPLVNERGTSVIHGSCMMAAQAYNHWRGQLRTRPIFERNCENEKLYDEFIEWLRPYNPSGWGFGH